MDRRTLVRRILIAAGLLAAAVACWIVLIVAANVGISVSWPSHLKRRDILGATSAPGLPTARHNPRPAR